MRVYPVINVVLAPSIPSSVYEVEPSRRSASFVSSPLVFVGLPDVRRFLFFFSSSPLPNTFWRVGSCEEERYEEEFG